MANAAWLELISSRFRSITCNKNLYYPYYQSCTNSSSPLYTNFSVMTIPVLCSSKCCVCSPPSFQQLRALGIWLSTHLMCTARISNSHLAANNSSSLRHPCRNELCILSIFNTIADVLLSHWIMMHSRRCSFPYTFVAATTVSKSRTLILSLLYTCGNLCM